MTAEERIDSIVRLLRTRDENLPEPVRRTEAARGFVHVVTDAAGREANTETCPDCLANDRVMFGCETCGGSGHVKAPRNRDPYATEVVMPYGFDGNRHEAAKARDRQIEILGQQLRPASTVDEIADANRHPFGWELARRRMYDLFDYQALDRALEQLRDADESAYRLLHAVDVYGWLTELSPAAEAVRERGLAFLDDLLPDPLRAPAAALPPANAAAHGRRAGSADPRAITQRDEAIWRAIFEDRIPTAEVAATFGLTVSQVNRVVARGAA